MDELILAGWTVMTVLVMQADLVSGLVLGTFLVAYLVYSLKNWALNRKTASGHKFDDQVR